MLVLISRDGTCKVWDCKLGDEVGTYDCKTLPQDLHWNYSGNLFSHQNSAVRKLYLENTSAGFTECSRGATKGDASFDMLMTAANKGRCLFAAKDCSAAGRCRVAGFQRPLNSKKNLAGVFPSPARFNPQFSQPKVRRNTMKSSLSSLSS